MTLERTCALSEAADAMRYLAAGHARGKIPHHDVRRGPLSLSRPGPCEANRVAGVPAPPLMTFVRVGMRIGPLADRREFPRAATIARAMLPCASCGSDRGIPLSFPSELVEQLFQEAPNRPVAKCVDCSQRLRSQRKRTGSPRTERWIGAPRPARTSTLIF